jgi:D-methionine transport system substrate-binding protein
MKKLLSLLATLTLVLLLAACGSSEGDSSAKSDSDSGSETETTTVTVGATSVPHAEILEKAKPLLKEKGINLEIEEFSKYAVINKALNTGDLDANYFQHAPYLETELAEHEEYDIVNVGKIHIEPMGIYSKEYDSVEDLPEGAQIIMSNSVAEHGRILSLLESEGLITLKEDVGYNATLDDIAKNPKNVKIRHDVAPELLPRVYNNGEGDAVVINTNYALEAGLNPTEDAIAMEGEESPYANFIAVNAEDKDNEAIQTVVHVLQSEEIQSFIIEKYEGAVVPVGGK